MPCPRTDLDGICYDNIDGHAVLMHDFKQHKRSGSAAACAYRAVRLSLKVHDAKVGFEVATQVLPFN